MTEGLIVKILPFSLVDGPGNRSVVFLAGCNFACKACHNPHTIGVCDNCGTCAPVCPTGALTPAYDPSRCVGCDRCLAACPKHSTPKARHLTPNLVMAELAAAREYVSGLTVSGGEPTLQADFVLELVTLARGSGLSTLIDSNGSTPQPVWERLAPLVDGVALDIKAIDPALHHALTGSDLAPVLSTAAFLAKTGKLMEVRHLIIPGYTDSPEHVSALATWLTQAAPGVPLTLLVFRGHGVRGALASTPSPVPALMERMALAARAAGVAKVRIRGLLPDQHPTV